jgi:hypothetical protein
LNIKYIYILRTLHIKKSFINYSKFGKRKEKNKNKKALWLGVRLRATPTLSSFYLHMWRVFHMWRVTFATSTPTLLSILSLFLLK